MKKFLTLFSLCAILFSSCVKQGDIDSLKDDLGKLENRVKTLETLCETMNTNITSLQAVVNALENADFVTSVEEVKEGDVVVAYKLSFKKANPVTINIGGTAAAPAAPEIGVKQEEGIYYWTLDGEFITDDNGAKIPVTSQGATPQLKIEEGFWYVSYNGQEWEKLGAAQGASGDSMFKALTPGDGFVTITLANDMQISLPMYVPVSITLDKTEVLAYAGDEVEVNYTINSQVNTPLTITATTDGYYKARVAPKDGSSGKITITCPDPIVPGVINVAAFDGKSYVAVALISVKENPVPITIAGTYSIKQHGVISFAPVFDNGDAKGNFFSVVNPGVNPKEFCFVNSSPEKDNKLILTRSGKTAEGYEIGTANYTAGADGEYGDFTLKASYCRHNGKTANDSSAQDFYSFIPHGESEYVYDFKENKVTFTQGEKTVVVSYYPEGEHTFSKDITYGGVTKNKTFKLTIPSMALDFPMPAEFRTMLTNFVKQELQNGGKILWNSEDWILYWAENCYMSFTKE